jgi:hypothetical protein
MNTALIPPIAGMIAGMTIAAAGMIYGRATGRGFWTLPNAIGGIALGAERGASRAFGVPTLAGVTFHMGLSALYGVAIVYLAMNLTHEYLITGAVFGSVAWLLNYYGVGAIQASAKGVAQVNPAPVAVALHALFGLIVGALADILLR